LKNNLYIIFIYNNKYRSHFGSSVHRNCMHSVFASVSVSEMSGDLESPYQPGSDNDRLWDRLWAIGDIIEELGLYYNIPRDVDRDFIKKLLAELDALEKSREKNINSRGLWQKGDDGKWQLISVLDSVQEDAKTWDENDWVMLDSNEWQRITDGVVLYGAIIQFSGVNPLQDVSTFEEHVRDYIDSLELILLCRNRDP